jgi:hypothetical protein
MRYYDFHFTINGNIFELDEEVDIDKTDWQEGDLFRLEIVEGNNAIRFVRLSKLEKFILDPGK